MKRTVEETIKLRNEILEYIIEYKAEHGGDSPAVNDLGSAFGIAKSTAKYHLDALHRDGKVEIINLGQRKTAIKVLFPPSVDGVTDIGKLKVLDFNAGRAWVGEGKAIFEVRQTYLKSVAEFQEFIDQLIAAQDRVLGE